MEHEKIQASANESGADIALALELVGVGSYDSALTILERYLAANTENGTSALVSLALTFRSRTLEHYISKTDSVEGAQSALRFDIVAENVGKIVQWVSLLNEDVRTFFVGTFLDEYITRVLMDKSLPNENILSFLCAIQGLFLETGLSYITAKGFIFGERFATLMETDAKRELWQGVIDHLYRIDKSAYAKEEVCRARAFMEKEEFEEASECLENALPHLTDTIACRFLMLCVALGAKDEETFVAADGFTMDMPEYVNLLVALKGHPAEMAKYTALAERNVKAHKASGEKSTAKPSEEPKAEHSSYVSLKTVLLVALGIALFILVFYLCVEVIGCGKASTDDDPLPPSQGSENENNPETVRHEGYIFRLNNAKDGYVFVGVEPTFTSTELDLLNTSAALPLPLKEIAEEAMMNNTTIRYGQMPDTVEVIGERAFKGCTSLEGPFVCRGTKYIGASAFENCTAMEGSLDLRMYNGLSYTEDYVLEHIGENAFSNTGLEELTLPDSLLTIGNAAFANCVKLTSVKFSPDSRLTEIGNGAFENTTPQTFFLPKNVERFPELDFFKAGHKNFELYFCGSMQEGENNELLHAIVTEYTPLLYHYNPEFDENDENLIPGNYWLEMGIGTGSYQHDLSFVLSDNEEHYIVDGRGSYPGTNLVIPSYHRGKPVKEIAMHAFHGDHGHFQKVFIPSTIETIEEGAFFMQGELESVTFAQDSQRTQLGTVVFGYCRSLSSITLPMHLSYIPESTFAGCTSLETVEILCTIGFEIRSRAFIDCSSLKNFTVPEYTSLIGSEAFSGCTALSQIEIPKSVIDMGEGAFEGCTNLTLIACENSFLPASWDENWNPDSIPVTFAGVPLE